jgi:hypothetical protein
MFGRQDPYQFTQSYLGFPDTFVIPSVTNGSLVLRGADTVYNPPDTVHLDTANALVSVKHFLAPGYGVKQIYIRLYKNNNTDSITIYSSIKVRRPAPTLTITEDSTIFYSQGNKYAQGLSVPFLFDTKMDPSYGDSVTIWLITPVSVATVRSDDQKLRFTTGLGGNRISVSRTSPPRLAATKQFYEAQPMSFPIPLSGVVMGTYQINLDSVYKTIGDSSYPKDSGIYNAGVPGAITGRPGIRVANCNADTIFFLDDSLFGTYRPIWVGKKEFILVAHTLGKEFRENRITCSDLSNRSVGNWDKYPPVIIWHPNSDVRFLASGYAPVTMDTLLDSISRIVPKARYTWDNLENLSALGTLTIALASGPTVSTQEYDYSVIDTGGVVTSLKLFMIRQEDFVRGIYAPEEYLLDASSGFIPGTASRIKKIVFETIDISKKRSGIYRVWVETEDNLGNRGMAGTKVNDKYGSNPRYIYINNGF